VLWKQDSFLVLRPFQIEFFRNLLDLTNEQPLVADCGPQISLSEGLRQRRLERATFAKPIAPNLSYILVFRLPDAAGCFFLSSFLTKNMLKDCFRNLLQIENECLAMHLDDRLAQYRRFLCQVNLSQSVVSKACDRYSIGS
jgi:hypothetical protein